MAVATAVEISGPSGQRVYAGRFGPGALSGGAALGELDASGSLAGTLGATVATLTLTSPATGAAPFALAQAFRQGDIPAGAGVVVTGATAQAVIKNTWPDGSAKIALVAGTASLTANAPATISFSAGAASSGTELTTADLKAALTQPVTVDAGTFGSASWSNTDWDAPFQTWVSGHRMSSWLYRKAVGSDAHLVAWLEVRLFAGGAVEILPWMENGYLLVASPTNKSATYTFTMGGTQRFTAAIDLKNHQRTPLVSGSLLAHWLGTDPAVTVKHSEAYLQATEMVPSYYATVSPSAGTVTGLPSAFDPLQQGSYPIAMGSAGYHGSIGLLPEWDVFYLTTTASNVWAALQRNAYSAGRYGIHYRDEATNRPLRFSQWPNLVLSGDGNTGVVGVGASSTNQYTPNPAGGSPAAFNTTHAPAMGYMAYLVTGRYYHLETTQFQATISYLKNTDTNRSTSQGVMATAVGANTVRGAAWSLRTLAQALAIAPDGDVLQTELKASFEANVSRYHARYVGQANNPFGWVTPFNDYTTNGDGIYFEATWQQDFFTSVFGMAKSLGLPLTGGAATQLSEFFAWKAKSVVGRLGGFGATEYPWPDAAPYTIAVAPTDTPNFGAGTGPWYASWGATYDATEGSPNRSGTAMRGTIDATSYWGNLMPALAYAVRHGVASASAAIGRLTAATNWSTLLASFDVSPVWGVKPLTDPAAVPASALAALAATMSAGQWAQLTGVTGLSAGLFIGGAVGNNIIDWVNKMCWDPVAQQVRWISQGHNDEQAYYGLDAESNVFSKLADPPWDTGGTGYPGYLGHGYHHNAMDPATGDHYYRMTGSGTVRRLDASSGAWSTLATSAFNGYTIANALEWLPGIGTQGGLVTVNDTTVQRWDKATNTWSTVTSSLASRGNHPFAVCSAPNGVVLFGGGNGGGTALFSVGATGSVTALASCPISISSIGNIPVCDPVTGDLIVFGGTSGTYRYSVAGNSWSSVTLTGAPSFGTPNESSRILAAALPDHGVIAFLFGNSNQFWLNKHA